MWYGVVWLNKQVSLGGLKKETARAIAQARDMYSGRNRTRMKKNRRMKEPRVLATTMERPIAPRSLNRLTAIVCIANMIPVNQKNLSRHHRNSAPDDPADNCHMNCRFLT